MRRRRPGSLLLAASVGFMLVASALAGDLEDAQALKAAGKWEAALQAYERAAAAEPDNAAASAGLVEVLAGLGQYDRAIEVGREAQDRHPKNVDVLMALARAFMVRADRRAADGADSGMILADAADGDAIALKILAIDDKHPGARTIRARAKMHPGDVEGAIELLNEVLVDFPNDFDANWELGQHWFRQARIDKTPESWAKGEARFRAAFEGDPTSGEAAMAVGDAMAWQRKPQMDVAAMYEQAALLLPGRLDILKKLYQWAAADPAELVAKFERVTAKHPKSPEALVYLAFAQRAAGQEDAAFETIARAQKVAPGSYFAKVNEGYLCVQAGRYDDAIDAFERAFSMPDSFNRSDYLFVTGKLAFETSALSTEQRERCWQVAWKAYPAQGDGPNNAGFWYRDHGRNAKKSAEWYERAAKAAPKSPQILNDTGLIYHYNLKQPEKGEPFYIAAIKAGIETGNDNPYGQSTEEIGYRDAVNNLLRLLTAAKRWKDIGKIADDLLNDDPRYDQWKQVAKSKGK